MSAPRLPARLLARLPARLLACTGRAATLALALVAASAPAGAQDFRDPAGETFTVWPNIPVIRASDLGEYAHDRQIIADLHADKADPAKVAAALQAVDGLQAHHERTALAELGRSLNVQLIAELDRQARRINTRSPKLRFDFADITPDQLQRPLARDNLPGRAGRTTLAAYITYTRLDGALVQATATLVKLRSGASQSFTATAPAPQLAEALARDLFDYFQGTRFTAPRNPLGGAQWLTAAPGHADRLVSRDAALRYCQSQNAALPTAEELESAEAAGFHGGGVALQAAGVYHVDAGLYDTAAPLDGAGRARPNHLANVPNGYYYCIRHAPPPAPARSARSRR
ncbi:hypothetical protein [Diaphorobacter nitroreducens]|uniref:hypothetical protein n=1 Tax=Diaphorobacter nitroreducens TaxID=164759 RepID=UPI0035B0F4FE